MVLGGGPNRIGQGVEFDYCCVHAALAMREDGYETIMVNCNPETVSTDYDTSDRLYFESLTLEDVLEIVALEKPVGVIVQYGGQTPLKLALALAAAGVPIIGTSPDMIDAAEDRERFQQLLHTLGLRQPPNRTARTEDEAHRLAQEIGYPLVVRPSYVLGGRAMEIVEAPVDLERYMREAVNVSHDSPVLLDRFLNDAIEVDVDCLSDGRRTFIGGVMEHVEQAGVHSRRLHELGFSICASTVTATIIGAGEVPVVQIDDKEVLHLLAGKGIALVIVTVDEKRSSIIASRELRVAALKAGVPACTTITGAEAVIEALGHADSFDLYTLQDLHRGLAVGTAVHPSGRPAPSATDLNAAAIVVPDRRIRPRAGAVLGADPVKVFIRQPFTESDHEQQRMIADILLLIDSANGSPYTFNYLTGIEAESADTFKKSFERTTQLPFTPPHFREYRLGLLAQAEVFINIRVGMSESSAFELGYHIFKGTNAPILFLVWKDAPIKTTLLRELENLNDATYLEFGNVDDLRHRVHQFFNTKALGEQASAA